MSIRENIKIISENIAAAAEKAGRDPAEVSIIAAAKTQPPERLKQAIEAGVNTLGENRVQEAQTHMKSLAGVNVIWHCIGHLQRNKAREALSLFAMIHSLDSLRLAHKIEEEAKTQGKKISALLQINISGEETKGGFSECNLEEILGELNRLEMIELQGLMTMPPFFDDPEKARPFFRRLAELKEAANQGGWYRAPLEQLSMGMSGDYQVAVEEGATLVRLGTVLFGPRA